MIVLKFTRHPQNTSTILEYMETITPSWTRTWKHYICLIKPTVLYILRSDLLPHEGEAKLVIKVGKITIILYCIVTVESLLNVDESMLPWV